MQSNQKIALNTLFLYFRLLVVLVTSLYTLRVVMNALGVVDFGIYSVVAGLVAMFAFLNNTMSIAAQRFFGINIGRKENIALGKNFNAALVLHCMIALVVIILSESLGMWLLNHKLEIPAERLPAANLVLHLSVAAVVALVLRTPYNALIIAQQRMWFFSILSVGEAFLRLGIAFAITQTVFDRLAYYAALMCTVSWLMLTAYMLFCRMKFAEARIVPHQDWPLYRALLAFVSWRFIGSLSAVGRNQGVGVLLNLFFGPILNATHGVMTQAQNAVGQFTGSFQMAISPQIYQSHGEGDRQRMHSLVFAGARLNFMLLAVLVAPAIYGMDYLLKLWLGSPPPYAATFINWMLVVMLVETVSQPLMTAAAATGNIRNYHLTMGGTILLNLPLSWLVFKLGSGPLAFLYVAFVIQLLAFWIRLWFLRSMIDLDVRMFLSSVIFPMLMISFFGGALLYAVDVWPGPPESFWGLLLGGCAILLPLGVVCFFLGLSRSERSFLLEKFKQKRT